MLLQCLLPRYRVLHVRATVRQRWRVYSSAADSLSRTVRIPCHSNGSIDLDIYTPPINQHQEGILPRVLLHLPPGPLLYHEPDNDTAFAELAADLSCHVVKVNYRLSSEHLYPGPIHDVLAAYDWIKHNLLTKRSITRLGRPGVVGRIAVHGELIGGGLAAMLAMTECHKGQPGIIAAALHNPIVDWVDIDAGHSRKHRTKTQHDHKKDHDLTTRLYAMRRHVFHKPEHYFDPFASPMLFLRSPGAEIPTPVHQTAPLDDMAQLAMHTRELTEDYTSATEAQSTFLPAQPQAKPPRKAAKRFPSPTLGLKLPPFYITADASSPLHTQAEEFVQRLRQSHTRQIRGSDFGRKVLTEHEIEGLSEGERQDYEDIDDESRDMNGATRPGHLRPSDVARPLYGRGQAEHESQPYPGSEVTRTTTTTETISTYQVQQQQQQAAQPQVQTAVPAYSLPGHNAIRIVAGGATRQAAAAQGRAALASFDSSVQHMLMAASQSMCPMGFRYYQCTGGYLCGGGSHYCSDDQVDLVMSGMLYSPFIEMVNTPESGGRVVAPPAEGWHEPMHWDPATRVANGVLPMPIRYDGTKWQLGPHGFGYGF